MIKKFLSIIIKCLHRGRENAFSLVELLVSVAVISIILLAIASFLFSMSLSGSKTKSDWDASENSRRALDEIVYEIRSAKSVYTPTSTAHQLSLETYRDLAPGENTAFVDLFLCGTAVCLKKEFQDPVAITSDSVRVTDLSFSQISVGEISSIKIDLTVNSGSGESFSNVSLTTTASLRGY